MKNILIPVILSGGAGTRLWPVSREAHPKPFIRLSDRRSLFQKAFQRAASLPDVTEVLTVTNRDYYFRTRDEIAELGAKTASRFVLEPLGRNTAPAILLAALDIAARHGKEAVMLVLPADHLIRDTSAFALDVAKAVLEADAGRLVTFGIAPTAPETGFGYIATGEACISGSGARQVIGFREKPSLTKAQEYLESGAYLWNAGMFCMQAGTLIAAFAQYAATLHDQALVCQQASQIASLVPNALELEAASFAACEDISIDYAIMEKANNVSVVAASFDWSDIGSWTALAALTPEDENGNRKQGDVVTVDVKNTYIQGDDRLIAAIGLDDLIIVDTPDALLVSHRDRVQDVRMVVKQLKENGHAAANLHRTMSRPWGTYTVLEEGPRYKIKRIEVRPGASLSLQMHHHRSEHWIVVSGMAKIVNGEREMLVQTNESTYIPAGHRHRLENPGVISLVMIEVQSGEYLGEDDIVRFEDRYGRA